MIVLSEKDIRLLCESALDASGVSRLQSIYDLAANLRDARATLARERQEHAEFRRKVGEAWRARNQDGPEHSDECPEGGPCRCDHPLRLTAYYNRLVEARASLDAIAAGELAGDKESK